MHCSVIFLALLAAVLLRRNSVHASSNWVASVSTSEWTDVWRSAMSLYSTDNEYHSKSMGSTLNHSARQMQEMSKEQVPCVVCGNRDKDSILAMKGEVASRPVHGSPDRICFLRNSNAYELGRLLSENKGVYFAHPVPAAAKISPSVHVIASKWEEIVNHNIVKESDWMLLAEEARLGSLIVTLSPGKGTSAKDVKDLELSWWETLHVMGPEFWAKQELDYADTDGGGGNANIDEEEGASSSPWLLYVRAAEKAQQLDCNFSSLTVEPMLDSMAVILNHGERNIRQLVCMVGLVAFLSTQSEVAYIEDIPQVVGTNIEGSWITQSGSTGYYPIWNAGITGETEIISVADTGLDVSSCYFSEEDISDNIACSTYTHPITDLTKRKVVQYVTRFLDASGNLDCSDVPEGHGTHVAGSVAGKYFSGAAAEHFGDGTAPGAKIAFFALGDATGTFVTPANLQIIFQPGYDAGARVHSNSWGIVDKDKVSYTSYDQQMDSWAFTHTDSLIIVAAGNCGDASAQCGFSGAGSILSPGHGKNVLTVGASESSVSTKESGESISEIAYFSSQGPLPDGRIKPDVVAPGYHIFSASSSSEPGTCSVGSMAGTSMSTPIVAGSASLVRQYFVQGWYPTGYQNPSNIYNPSGALIKAMLIHSAIGVTSYDGIEQGDITLGSPPDGYQGHGRVMLDSVLNIHGRHLFSTTGEFEEYPSFDMTTDEASNLEGDFVATLVFFEEEAASYSTQPVFNDLDLIVIAYTAEGTPTYFYPNDLSNRDSTNTVEKVIVPDPKSYAYIDVRVEAASIVTSTRPYYALVVTAGTAPSNNNPSQDSGSWFVRARAQLVGSPPTEVALEGFAVGLGKALALNSAGIIDESSVALVALTSVEGDPKSSVVTLDIDVEDYENGESVMGYFLQLSLSNQQDGGKHIADDINSALSGITTTGCHCAILQSGGFDCTSCVDGEPYSTISNVTIEEGSFELLSLSDYNQEGANDSSTDKIRIPIINNIVRTSNIYYIMAVCSGIIFFTALVGLIIRFKKRDTPDVDSNRISFNSSMNTQLLSVPHQLSNSLRL